LAAQLQDFKIGLTTSAEKHSCSDPSKPGSLGYENLDAIDFGKWGVHYLKYEYCNITNDKRKIESVKVMSDTLS
jgi:alpha-galactosidase